MTTLRLLTANLCMKSPHTGSMQHTVTLSVAGLIVLVMLLVATLVFSSVVRTHWLEGGIGCWLFASYMLAGVYKFAGPIWSVLLLALSISETFMGLHALVPTLTVTGYLFLGMPIVGHFIAQVVLLVKPSVFDDKQDERLDDFVQMLSKYDVVCLQELTVFWGKDSHIDTVRFAKHGLKHCAYGSRWPGFPAICASNGLVVLSRYPILRMENLHFTRQAWFEWSCVSRGALMVEIDGPEGRVALMNLHTTAGIEVVEVRLCGQHNQENPVGMQQILEGMNRFEAFSKTSNHRICCGDFNLTKDSHALKIVLARAKTMGLHDCYPDSPPTYGCDDEVKETLLTVLGDQCNPKVLDHVFSDRYCKAAEVDKLEAPEASKDIYQQVSDHRGVAVTWSHGEAAQLEREASRELETSTAEDSEELERLQP